MIKMISRTAQRSAVFAVSVLALSLVVFAVARLAPGDPLLSYYGDRVERMSDEERLAAETKLGLREPILTQYVRWLEGAVHGEFGISFKYKTDVLEVILARVGGTLVLGGIGFLLTFVSALLLGIISAWYEGRALDRLICSVGTVISCVPEFWLSMVLIMVFSVWLGWLPSGGAYSYDGGGGAADRLRHLVLPMVVVLASHLWYYGYMIRNKILDEMRADYVLLARAAGASRARVMWRHCVMNILPTYLSIMAISVPHIMGGTYIAETIFSYPGIGILTYESARFRDYNMLMVLCMISGVIVIAANVIAGAINERIDPRIRAEEAMTDE